MDFLPKNGQIWPQTGIFGQISAFVANLISCRPKNNADKLSRWFFHYEITKTFTYSHKNLDFVIWWWRLAAGDLHSCHRQRADCSQSQRLLARSKSGGCLFFNSVLPPASSTWQTNPSKVSSMEKLSYYHLSMEEGEVNDNTIKLTRAVNSDLTPTVWTGKSYLQ